MEEIEGHSLHPSFAVDILDCADNYREMVAMTAYMQAAGICNDKYGEPDDEEFVIMQHWAYRFDNESKRKEVLLVATNRGIREFVKPVMGNADKLKQQRVIFYDMFAALTRSHSGQAAEWDFYLDNAKLLKTNSVYLIHEYTALDDLMKIIMRFAPHTGRTRTTLWVEDSHLVFLLEAADGLNKGEELKVSFVSSFGIAAGKAMQDVYFVITNQRLLVYQADFRYWHKLAPDKPLPWWSDKARYAPMMSGTGWEGRFLRPIQELALGDIKEHGLGYNPKTRRATLSIVSESKDAATKSFTETFVEEFKNLTGGAAASANTIVVSFASYANATYWEQLVSIYTGKSPRPISQ